MMDFDPAEIRNLTIDEIAGVITSKEKEHLYRVIAENQEAFKLWQELHQALGPQQILEAEESMRAFEPQRIIDTHKKRQRSIRILKTAGMMTVMILLVTGASYFLFTPINKQSKPDITGELTVADKQHILLLLDNGKNVDLSVDTQQVHVADITLINTRDTLHYPAHTAFTGPVTLRVPAGEDYNIVLPDKTEIQINSATTLTFPAQFTGSTREITITGEAYLKVAPDARRPFFVHLPGNNTVKVLGTEFNVNTYNSGTVKVSLVSGAISMKKGADSSRLNPGKEIISIADSAMRTKEFKEDMVLSWRKGIYVFGENTTLQEVCRVLFRWYGVEAVIDNPGLEKHAFSGMMDRNKPLQEFLERVKRTEAIDHYFDNNRRLHFK